ncbi:MAG: glycosyltransferase family 1 protein [Planctomycetaceae bacterium]|nr:glycosyltransferase family 1 protein [Planctomycetaceae bacterium]
MRTIDFVAPPFAGHLFPALQLAKGLAERGVARVRILSSPGAAGAIAAAGLSHVEFLKNRDAEIWAIANTPRRVGSNPFAMWNQVQRNLALMKDLQNELSELWSVHPPDLVIADFVVPVAGLTAKSLGIPWWTGMPTPCVLETRDGTPAYLGGWRSYDNPLARIRDLVGRRIVRTFKKTSARLFAAPLRELGIEGLYRADGTEVVYSSDCILAYGMKEFEFSRTWPEHVEFIGPLTESPFPSEEFTPQTCGGNILISLGTHLPWAKERAIDLFRQVARIAPEFSFYFSRGIPGSDRREVEGNYHLYDYISYSHHMAHFSAAVIHGGTGVTYSAIEAGLPMLVWPQDYDQFDHAARIVQHGLGKRLRPSPKRIAADLRELTRLRRELGKPAESYREIAKTYDPVERVARAVQGLE